MVSGKYPAKDEMPQIGNIAPGDAVGTMPVALTRILAERDVTLTATVCARQHPHVEI